MKSKNRYKTVFQEDQLTD
jgi:hypothetical protein